MHVVPVIKVRDLRRSVQFYTEVLDFAPKWPEYAEQELANGVIALVRGEGWLQLSHHAGDGQFGSLTRVYVDDVDERYRTFLARGYDASTRPESPVHTAPIDQTWGLREWAVTDPDGNGLLFCAPVK